MDLLSEVAELVWHREQLGLGSSAKDVKVAHAAAAAHSPAEPRLPKSRSTVKMVRYDGSPYKESVASFADALERPSSRASNGVPQPTAAQGSDEGKSGEVTCKQELTEERSLPRTCSDTSLGPDPTASPGRWGATTASRNNNASRLSKQLAVGVNEEASQDTAHHAASKAVAAGSGTPASTDAKCKPGERGLLRWMDAGTCNSQLGPASMQLLPQTASGGPSTASHTGATVGGSCGGRTSPVAGLPLLPPMSSTSPHPPEHPVTIPAVVELPDAVPAEPDKVQDQGPDLAASHQEPTTVPVLEPELEPSDFIIKPEACNAAAKPAEEESNAADAAPSAPRQDPWSPSPSPVACTTSGDLLPEQAAAQLPAAAPSGQFTPELFSTAPSDMARGAMGSLNLQITAEQAFAAVAAAATASPFVPPPQQEQVQQVQVLAQHQEQMQRVPHQEQEQVQDQQDSHELQQQQQQQQEQQQQQQLAIDQQHQSAMMLLSSAFGDGSGADAAMMSLGMPSASPGLPMSEGLGLRSPSPGVLLPGQQQQQQQLAASLQFALSQQMPQALSQGPSQQQQQLLIQQLQASMMQMPHNHQMIGGQGGRLFEGQHGTGGRIKQQRQARIPDQNFPIVEHGYKYIVQVGDKWRAQVGNMESGVQRKYYSAYVRSPEQAAGDADMLLYKLRGPAFPLNLGLSAEQKARLDVTSLQELLQSFHLRGPQEGSREKYSSRVGGSGMSSAFPVSPLTGLPALGGCGGSGGAAQHTASQLLASLASLASMGSTDAGAAAAAVAAALSAAPQATGGSGLREASGAGGCSEQQQQQQDGDAALGAAALAGSCGPLYGEVVGGDHAMARGGGSADIMGDSLGSSGGGAFAGGGGGMAEALSQVFAAVEEQRNAGALMQLPSSPSPGAGLMQQEGGPPGWAALFGGRGNAADAGRAAAQCSPGGGGSDQTAQAIAAAVVAALSLQQQQQQQQLHEQQQLSAQLLQMLQQQHLQSLPLLPPLLQLTSGAEAMQTGASTGAESCAGAGMGEAGFRAASLCQEMHPQAGGMESAGLPSMPSASGCGPHPAQSTPLTDLPSTTSAAAAAVGPLAGVPHQHQHFQGPAAGLLDGLGLGGGDAAVGSQLECASTASHGLASLFGAGSGAFEALPGTGQHQAGNNGLGSLLIPGMSSSDSMQLVRALAEVLKPGLACLSSPGSFQANSASALASAMAAAAAGIHHGHQGGGGGMQMHGLGGSGAPKATRKRSLQRAGSSGTGSLLPTPGSEGGGEEQGQAKRLCPDALDENGRPYRYIVKIGNKWRAQVGCTVEGVQRKYYSAYVSDPKVAAKDADMILYKLRGVLHCNFPLTGEESHRLDGMTMQTLMESLKGPSAPRTSVGQHSNRGINTAAAMSLQQQLGGMMQQQQQQLMMMQSPMQQLQLQQHLQQLQEQQQLYQQQQQGLPMPQSLLLDQPVVDSA